MMISGLQVRKRQLRQLRETPASRTPTSSSQLPLSRPMPVKESSEKLTVFRMGKDSNKPGRENSSAGSVVDGDTCKETVLGMHRYPLLTTTASINLGSKNIKTQTEAFLCSRSLDYKKHLASITELTRGTSTSMRIVWILTTET